jgi:luciferase family oxidoreductase group 1
MRALRRDVTASDTFPQDVVELQGFLSDQSPIANVKAVPGRGTHVPIYILGSSLFGATLAGALGLPYGFASHFAPEALQQAIQRYRQHFTPSAQADRPHAIAGVNVIAAEDHDDAQAQLTLAKRQRISGFLGRGRPEPFTEAEIDALLESPQGRSILEMMRYTVAGTPDEVRRYLEDFKAFADADELIITLPSPTAAQRQRSAELTAAALAE